MSVNFSLAHSIFVFYLQIYWLLPCMSHSVGSGLKIGRQFLIVIPLCKYGLFQNKLTPPDLLSTYNHQKSVYYECWCLYYTYILKEVSSLVILLQHCTHVGNFQQTLVCRPGECVCVCVYVCEREKKAHFENHVVLYRERKREKAHSFEELSM